MTRTLAAASLAGTWRRLQLGRKRARAWAGKLANNEVLILRHWLMIFQAFLEPRRPDFKKTSNIKHKSTFEQLKYLDNVSCRERAFSHAQQLRFFSEITKIGIQLNSRQKCNFFGCKKPNLVTQEECQVVKIREEPNFPKVIGHPETRISWIYPF